MTSTVDRPPSACRLLGAAGAPGRDVGPTRGEAELARRVADADAALRDAAEVAHALPLRAPEHILLRAALRRAVEALRDAEDLLGRVTGRGDRASA
jgi:hypothetical protein